MIKKYTMRVTMPKDLKIKLDIKAEDMMVSKSAIIRLALESYCKR